MEITDNRIDAGKAFDWGKTSEEYAKYRDIYPKEFYQKIIDRELCIKGQKVLDLGTGTGVLPRNMYQYGANWTGTDISPEQIEQAKRLSEAEKMEIDYLAVPTENIDLPMESFDVITACQCFWYFDHERVMPKLAELLKSNGKLLILYMDWLPYEDAIAGKSEEIILKHNPNWSSYGDTVHPVYVPEELLTNFEIVLQKEFRVDVPFTKESWHGRMRACRGAGAAMNEEQLRSWEEEHTQMLQENAAEEFHVKHYVSFAELQVKG